MARQLRPRSISLRPASHRRPAKTVQLRCERFEDKITPALFNVGAPQSFGTTLNNNGCVAVADLNKDGFLDAVVTNFGTDFQGQAANTIAVMYGRAGGGFNRLSLNTG